MVLRAEAFQASLTFEVPDSTADAADVPVGFAGQEAGCGPGGPPY